MSEICARWRSAAIRGATSLPKLVGGSRTCVYEDARLMTSAATSSAVGAAKCGASACNALSTLETFEAACAAPPLLWPATRTWISPPIFCAAAIVFSVALLSAALSCSAMTRMVMSDLVPLGPLSSRDHLRFVAQLRHQLLRVGDLSATLALRRLDDFQRSEPRRHVDAERVRLDHVERLLLRLHDVGQGRVARLVPPQVGGEHRRHPHRHRLQPPGDLALAGRPHLSAIPGDIALRSESGPA